MRDLLSDLNNYIGLTRKYSDMRHIR